MPTRISLRVSAEKIVSIVTIFYFSPKIQGLKCDQCVIFYGLRGHVLESCDLGSSWAEVETASESSISDAAVYDETVLLAANSGTLMIRDDSGQFDVYHHSSGVDFAAVYSMGDGSFLLVGEDGIHQYPEDK